MNNVPLSSVIIVLIVVSWVTYVFLYAHSRGQLSTGRVGDRDSEQMRVLQRRDNLSPGFASEVVTSSGTSRRSLLAAGALDSTAHSVIDGRGARGISAGPLPVTGGALPARAAGQGHSVERAGRRCGGQNPARHRCVAGAVALLGASGAVAGVTAAATGVLPWSVPVAAMVAALLLSVAVRRVQVVSRRRRAVLRRRASERARGIPEGRRAVQGRPAPVRPAPASRARPVTAVSSARVGDRAPSRVFDWTVFDEPVESAAPPAQVGTPLPTYILKSSSVADQGSREVVVDDAVVVPAEDVAIGQVEMPSLFWDVTPRAVGG